MKNIKTYLNNFIRTTLSLWQYQTQEDKTARNIWVRMVLSLLVLSTLVVLVEGVV